MFSQVKRVFCDLAEATKVSGLISALVLVLVVTGCSSDTTLTGVSFENDVRIQISGSSTVGPLVDEIGKRYERDNPGVRIEVQTGGSSRGIADAASGLADIGMSSRALKESEVAGRKSWPIAMDGVCFIVHGTNSISPLTKPQIVAILKGEVDNWKEFGGDDQSIVFINRAAGRSELELVTHFFEIETKDIKADLIAGENQQGIKMVASNVNSISYMSVGASEDAISRGTSIRMLPLEGVAATVANVESGTFPLSRPLILVTNETPNPAVQEFIRYAQSDAVEDLVHELSYVPINKR